VIDNSRYPERDVRAYFEQNKKVVSSPFSVFGTITPLGRTYLQQHESSLRDRLVLDAGSGVGLIASFVARKYGATVVALDYTHWVTETQEPALAVKGNILQLPFRNASFDTLMCFEALEHTIDSDQALGELLRVLRPGGSLLLSTPSYFNVAGLLKKLLEGLGVYKKHTFAPFDEWEPKVLERFLTSFGVRSSLKCHELTLQSVEGAELFDALFPFDNRIPGLFSNRIFLRVRDTVDRASTWPVLKWFALHGFFHAVRPGRTPDGNLENGRDFHF